MSYENERDEALTALLVGLAVLYDKELNPQAFSLYAAALRDMSMEDIHRAVEIYMANERNVKFPLPAQLKAALHPTDDQQARDAVSRIITGLTKYGGANDFIRAKEYVGELGWAVVERQGGWQRMCALTYADIGPNAQAQWRELAVSLMARERLGVRHEPPRLPSPPEKKELENLSFLPKLLDK